MEAGGRDIRREEPGGGAGGRDIRREEPGGGRRERY